MKVPYLHSAQTQAKALWTSQSPALDSIWGRLKQGARNAHGIVRVPPTALQLEACVMSYIARVVESLPKLAATNQMGAVKKYLDTPHIYAALLHYTPWKAAKAPLPQDTPYITAVATKLSSLYKSLLPEPCTCDRAQLKTGNFSRCIEKKCIRSISVCEQPWYKYQPKDLACRNDVVELVVGKNGKFYGAGDQDPGTAREAMRGFRRRLEAMVFDGKDVEQWVSAPVQVQTTAAVPRIASSSMVGASVSGILYGLGILLASVVFATFVLTVLLYASMGGTAEEKKMLIREMLEESRDRRRRDGACTWGLIEEEEEREKVREKGGKVVRFDVMPTVIEETDSQVAEAEVAECLAESTEWVVESEDEPGEGESEDSKGREGDSEGENEGESEGDSEGSDDERKDEQVAEPRAERVDFWAQFMRRPIRPLERENTGPTTDELVQSFLTATGSVVELELEIRSKEKIEFGSAYDASESDVGSDLGSSWCDVMEEDDRENLMVEVASDREDESELDESEIL